jgi:sugar-specific transcriptional regulator TrmB
VSILKSELNQLATEKIVLEQRLQTAIESADQERSEKEGLQMKLEELKSTNLIEVNGLTKERDELADLLKSKEESIIVLSGKLNTTEQDLNATREQLVKNADLLISPEFSRVGSLRGKQISEAKFNSSNF